MIAVAGNYAYLCGMRKLLCPQCKIAALYVVNDRKERLLVYVLENGEVVPKDPATVYLFTSLFGEPCQEQPRQ